MGIFEGLEKLGLDGFEDQALYEDKQQAPEPAPKKEAPKPPPKLDNEKDFLFDKKYVCPICMREFTAKTVRTGKVHTERIDYDLRPVYDTVDQVKYEVVACPHCGYAALLRYHEKSTDKQLAMVREAISSRFKALTWGTEIYTYDEAKLRYQLAIANAVARKAKPSEKAYLCLKSAWVLRGETDRLKADGADPAKIAENEAAEKKLLGQALDGFAQARQTENFPVAGMDEKTLDYVMCALYLSQDKFQDCQRFLGAILVNQHITPNLRKKAQDLKEMLDARMKEVKAGG